MNAQYRAGHSQAVNLQHQFRDHLDDKSLPMARELEHEIQKVVDEFEQERNPRSIEDVIKQVQRLLKDADRSTPPLMDNRHANSLHQEFEQLRMSLRKFDNF